MTMTLRMKKAFLLLPLLAFLSLQLVDRFVLDIDHMPHIAAHEFSHSHGTHSHHDSKGHHLGSHDNNIAGDLHHSFHTLLGAIVLSEVSMVTNITEIATKHTFFRQAAYGIKWMPPVPPPLI